jgi:hypothetical protein
MSDIRRAIEAGQMEELVSNLRTVHGKQAD